MFNFNPRFPRGKRHRLASEPVSVNRNFNPRFPRGKRPPVIIIHSPSYYFNPRFPRGKRRITMAGTASMRLFQSTFPAGEATYDNNPILKWCMTFQSTLPVGEATPFIPEHRLEEHISIHAFRGESDLSGTTTISAANDFNPRFPRGKRPQFPNRTLPV